MRKKEEEKKKCYNHYLELAVINMLHPQNKTLTFFDREYLA